MKEKTAKDLNKLLKEVENDLSNLNEKLKEIKQGCSLARFEDIRRELLKDNTINPAMKLHLLECIDEHAVVMFKPKNKNNKYWK